jgi:hypothetical protein
MNTRGRVSIWGFVAIVLYAQTIFSGLGIASEKKEAGTVIELRGKIVNLNKASKYITAESYLQLLFIPDNGSVSFETDDKGRTVYPSNLPRIHFPQDGNFNLPIYHAIFEHMTEFAKPGKYVIVGQNLNPYGLDSQLKPILSYLANKTLIIIHWKDIENRKVLNLGDVILPVPRN